MQRLPTSRSANPKSLTAQWFFPCCPYYNSPPCPAQYLRCGNQLQILTKITSSLPFGASGIVFRPQVWAGALPSGSFTTTIPRENSFPPTVWPTGARRFPPVSAVAHSARASASAAPKRTPFWMLPCKFIAPFAVNAAFFQKQIVDFALDIPFCIG